MRPVSSLHSTSAARPKRSKTRNAVRAGLPRCVTAMRVRARTSRPTGASIMPLAGGSPCTIARYTRRIVRSASCFTRSACALTVFATTSNPLVSLSRRCTMPARGTPASAGACASSALSSVRSGWPAPGCTTRPAGLSITISCASSCTTLSGMRCACGEASSGTGGGSSTMRSPPATGWLGSALLPSRVIWPDLSHACRRLREYCGNRRASAWSKRMPPSPGGTVALIAAAKAASQSAL